MGNESSDKLHLARLNFLKEHGKETHIVSGPFLGIATIGQTIRFHHLTSPLLVRNAFMSIPSASSTSNNDFIFLISLGNSPILQPEIISLFRDPSLKMFLGSFLRVLQSCRLSKSSISRLLIDSQTSTKLAQPLRINLSRLGRRKKLGVLASRLELLRSRIFNDPRNCRE